MADWILVPCLVKLRSEFNTIAPNRDKSSDGSIGDAAHQATQSDHNDDEVGNVPIHDADRIHEVHAIDVDVDLREPGLTMEMVVQFLLKRCRSGAEKRLRYIIYNRRIWQQSNGWAQQAYHGSNPHDHHAHFSSSYTTSLEASTASWHLEDIPVALTSADKSWIAAEINKVEERVWNFQLRNPYINVNQPAGTFLRFAPSRQPMQDLSAQIAALSAQVAELQKQVEQLQPMAADVD
ncbi:hypothetical protein Ade02nite_51120 [Paractinoplanes deccanensis]|uniref:Uncharacterized protein n=1 Tax=Paractinoplanes deccanensis TaxID=113561 RepID=A0ABQ3Y933_9ACTN|nr:hypothetical protein [Actinoplanes deccanensis]GID76471.1 hypothetical protein Ade02nite_51120 [Actinoplanes deccanensis]